MPLFSAATLDARIGTLPPLAPAAGQLLSLLGRDTVDIVELERTICHEPTLAGRVLRLANSPFFGFSGRVGSLREACLLLGARTLTQMAMAAAVMQQMPVDDTLLEAKALWRHALVTGAIAKLLAGETGGDEEQAFAAGLMHDLGKLALASYFPAEYRQVLQHREVAGGLLQEAEQAVLGFDHAAVGERLARKWHFPEALVLAVGYHHSPGGDWLSDVIHLSDVLAHALGDGATVKVPPLRSDAWERLELGWERLEKLLPTMDDAMREAAHFEL